MPRKPSRAKALGVSDEQYATMLEWQGGGCKLCQSTPKTRRLHVDHDHATGEVRGLLCHRCNRTMATWMTPNWCLNAAAYLYKGTIVYDVDDDGLLVRKLVPGPDTDLFSDDRFLLI